MSDKTRPGHDAWFQSLVLERIVPGEFVTAMIMARRCNKVLQDQGAEYWAIDWHEYSIALGSLQRQGSLTSPGIDNDGHVIYRKVGA